MTPERWQQIQAVFAAARQRAAAERTAFLDQACAHDPSLRADVERLLTLGEQADRDGFLALPGPPTITETTPPAADEALVGRRVGPYRIEARIGSGGMGSVYRAARVDDYRQEVALKVIKRGLDTGELLARFRTERQVLAELVHPHVARLLDGGTTEDGLPYIVMEYIDGPPLHHWCAGRPLPERVRLLHLVCLAVHHAHQRRVVHRDLKPGNVRVLADGTPKVTDFGLAKRLGGDPGAAAGPGYETPAGDTLGTPSYMAPEQAGGQSQEVGPSADVYALGAILYELLTDRPPFKAETPWQTIFQVLNEEPVPPSRWQRGVPRDLETICLKCLRKEPHRRYASAQELADDLGRFLAGESITARPVGQPERLWRWCKRNPAPAAAAGLAAAALVGFALYQSAVAARLREEQQKTQDALKQAVDEQRKTQDALNEAERLSRQLNKRLTLAEDLGLLERGYVGRGMLTLVRTLENAPADADDYQRAIRSILASCKSYLNPLRSALAHRERVLRVAFGANGGSVLTGCADNVARLWAADTGDLRQEFLHQDRVGGVAISRDGKTVLTGSRDKTARLWDAATGRLLLAKPLEHGYRVHAVALSPDGKLILTRGGVDPGGPGEVRLWAMDGELLHGGPLPDYQDGQGEKRSVGVARAVAFSADGRAVIAGGEKEIAQVWWTANGKPVSKPLTDPGNWIYAVDLSPDSRFALTAARTPKARLWNARTGDLIAELSHSGVVHALDFAPDGRAITGSELGAGEGEVRFWDGQTGAPLGVPIPVQGPVHALACRPDGRDVWAASAERNTRIWQVAVGEPLLRAFEHELPVWSVAFSPDGQSILTGSGKGSKGEGRLWSFPAGQPGTCFPHDGPVSVTFSPEGLTVLTSSSDKTARLWTVRGERIGKPITSKEWLGQAIFSPDGRTFLTKGEDKMAKLWRTADQAELVVLRHGDPVYGAAFSPDGRTILTGCMDGAARLWDAGTGQRRGRSLLHQGQVRAVAFHPRGELVLTASSDWTARLWRADSGEPVGPVLQHPGRVYEAVFSPDGKRAVTGCEVSAQGWGEVRLWDTEIGRPLSLPLRHPRPVGSAAFSPDGRLLLTACQDPRARLWAVPAPLEEPVERIRLWLEVSTGMELDAGGAARVLGPTTWQERRRLLDERGGPPVK